MRQSFSDAAIFQPRLSTIFRVYGEFLDSLSPHQTA
jgi:hypothetical protein